MKCFTPGRTVSRNPLILDLGLVFVIRTPLQRTNRKIDGTISKPWATQSTEIVFGLRAPPAPPHQQATSIRARPVAAYGLHGGFDSDPAIRHQTRRNEKASFRASRSIHP